MDKGFNLQLNNRPPTAKPKDACADGTLGHLVRMEALYKRKLKNKRPQENFQVWTCQYFLRNSKKKRTQISKSKWGRDSQWGLLKGKGATEKAKVQSWVWREAETQNTNILPHHNEEGAWMKHAWRHWAGVSHYPSGQWAHEDAHKNKTKWNQKHD